MYERRLGLRRQRIRLRLEVPRTGPASNDYGIRLMHHREKSGRTYRVLTFVGSSDLAVRSDYPEL